ncbi:MAG: hypothetical protein EA361_05560 [Bacteroidetes bacterium]|nr:MAG: hypothetical protein EA361_05560 [Bacteroidota bacterium]
MNKYYIILLALALPLVFSSCSKDKEDLLQGTWERVNVENINDPYSYEWVFNEGELTMYRRLKSDPSVFNVTDRGFYLLENTPLKTTLQLVETSNEVWNEKWDVVKLDDGQLIIKLDIVGGIIMREFVKKI